MLLAKKNAHKKNNILKLVHYLCNVYPIPKAPTGRGWADIYTYKA